MPEIVEAWPVKPKSERQAELEKLFDGKIYRVNPSEFDLDEDPKAFVAAVKRAASAATPRVYVRCFVTLDGHVFVSRQPEGYIPKRGGMEAARAGKAARKEKGV